MNKSFTILELILVVVISGVLIAMGVVSYQKTVRNTLIKEARSTIELITAAEKIYRSKRESLVTCSGDVDCKAALNIELGLTDWSFNISHQGGNTDIVNINATYTGSRSDITECYRTLRDKSQTDITCN